MRFPKGMYICGGIRDCRSLSSAEIERMARFAVQEHNKNQNSLLEYAKVLKAKEQLVAGRMYYLTMEAIDAGKKNIYEAKVWVRPWLNLKELDEFKQAQETRSFTSSDLGVKPGNRLYTGIKSFGDFDQYLLNYGISWLDLSLLVPDCSCIERKGKKNEHSHLPNILTLRNRIHSQHRIRNLRGI